MSKPGIKVLRRDLPKYGIWQAGSVSGVAVDLDEVVNIKEVSYWELVE
jgi:hypothetical protein